MSLIVPKGKPPELKVMTMNPKERAKTPHHVCPTSQAMLEVPNASISPTRAPALELETRSRDEVMSSGNFGTRIRQKDIAVDLIIVDEGLSSPDRVVEVLDLDLDQIFFLLKQRKESRKENNTYEAVSNSSSTVPTKLLVVLVVFSVFLLLLWLSSSFLSLLAKVSLLRSLICSPRRRKVLEKVSQPKNLRREERSRPGQAGASPK